MKKMNKKGGTLGILGLLALLIIGYACWDYYQETQGSNHDKAEFCKNLGYKVENEINPFYEIVCYKIEWGIRRDYAILETNRTIKFWDKKNQEHNYYLREKR